MNKYRYDGEMPPKIAAQFPVVNQRSDQDDAKQKHKRTIANSSRASALLSLGPALGNLLYRAFEAWGLINTSTGNEYERLTLYLWAGVYRQRAGSAWQNNRGGLIREQPHAK